MNSLENLNNWSNDDIPYNGDAAYSITFSPTTAVNQTTTVIEDSPFVSPSGINITSLVNTPRDIRYRIDLSAIALPATIQWGDYPGFVQSQVPAFNIFELVGPIDENIWPNIKSPVITIIDQATNFTYPASIIYPDPSNTANDLTKSWTVTTTVTAVPNISTPTAYAYTKNDVGTISGPPQILNTAAGTYSIVITPSLTSAVYLLSSTGSGGTSTFDPIYKTLTISGTKTQVNSHLNAVQFTPVSFENRAFVLSYSLTNPSGALNVVTQNLTSTDAFVINTATYQEDAPFSLGYVIQDASATATSFTISVAQTSPLPSVSPGYFTVNGSNVGNTWTAANTRTNINAANVIYTPPLDYSGTITMTVNQSKVDNGNTVVQITNQPVNILNNGSNPEISNMVNRSYTGGTVNNIFATQTPQITDGPNVGQTYTFTLYSSLGQFGTNLANALSATTFSFSGNVTACNSLFSTMVFVPNPGVSSTGTFTYTQSRNGTAQVNTNLTLTGSPGSSITPSTTIYTGNSSFSLSEAQVLYGNIQILTVGGGGAGHTSQQSSPRSGGGGGGGGGVFDVLANRGTANALSAGTYSVVVGAGGTTNGGNGGNSYISIGGVQKFVSGQGSGGDSADGGGSWFNGTQRAGGTGGTNARNDAGGGGGASPAQNGDSATIYGTTLNAGRGGIGYISNISGANVYYGAGGGGGVYDATGTPNPVVGQGGTGGGGRGSGIAGAGVPLPGTGVGAGGGGGTASNWGNGAAGQVIVKIS